LNLAWTALAGAVLVMVMARQDTHEVWKVLALATTFAGNLTIVGSVANMIVVESAREHIEVGFWDYGCFGIPITILTTAAGVIVLLLVR